MPPAEILYLAHPLRAYINVNVLGDTLVATVNLQSTTAIVNPANINHDVSDISAITSVIV